MFKGTRGFTLIELLVVIAIIGILAAIIAPNAFKAIEKSKVAAVESDYKAIKSATLMYYSDVGTWPYTDNNFGSDSDELVAFIDGGAYSNGETVSDSWDGPYLEKWPTRNPWGGTYTLASHQFAGGTDYYTSFGADAVTVKSANKVLDDLGDQVETADAGTYNGKNTGVELLFKVGIKQ